MLRWLRSLGGSLSDGGGSYGLPESQRDIETSQQSFVSRLFDPRQVTALPGAKRRTTSDGGACQPADEREMEEGVAAGAYGRQLTDPMHMGGGWDAPGKGGDATVAVAVYRGKPGGQQQQHQPVIIFPQQVRPPRPPRPAAMALATPPPPMVVPVWLQRRKKAMAPAAPEQLLLSQPQLPQPPAPCPLRPCPPSSTGPSSLRVESFTAGTAGRLMRPGVGIGAGTMREARYADLRFIHQIGEGGFGKVR